MKKYYVVLTGSINNAGDFLIKHRAKQLFAKLRPDREIVDINAWEPLEGSTLDIINNAEILILLGGPALQKKMYPKVYRLSKNLDDIKVPIVSMGIGWYSNTGNWSDTVEYQFTNESTKLLERINSSGYLSSVRDYHSLQVLLNKGYNNYLMTGCPAFYDTEFINKEFTLPKEFKTIAFSLGVSFKTSNLMFEQMKKTLLNLSSEYQDSKIITVFHHSLDENYLQTRGAHKTLYKMQKRFLTFLNENNLDYIDISGSADNLIDFYSTVDLHIGYRVHAHIFCSSISKPSVLLNEDGRGKAQANVLSGLAYDAYESVNTNILLKALAKINIRIDNFKPMEKLESNILKSINYEYENGVKFYQPRLNIDTHYKVMKRFINQLP